MGPPEPRDSVCQLEARRTGATVTPFHVLRMGRKGHFEGRTHVEEQGLAQTDVRAEGCLETKGGAQKGTLRAREQVGVRVGRLYPVRSLEGWGVPEV